MQLYQAVESFLSGYFSTCQRSHKTQTAYTIDLGQFTARMGSQVPLEVIAPDLLEQWAKALTASGYAAVSVRRKFAALRVFFSYWVRRGSLTASPLLRIKLDLSTERRLPRALSSSDAQRLLERAWIEVPVLPTDGVQPHDRGFIAFRNATSLEILFATGVRVGELVSLDLGAWNDADGAFIIQGKGARQRVAVLPDARTTDCVRSYVKCRSVMDLGHSALLVNASGKRLSAQGVARALNGVAVKSGIDRKITPHMLRHTVATLLLRHGADIRVVQEVLGHSSITMTERYTHVSNEHLRSTLTAHHPNNHLVIRRPNMFGPTTY